jgi:hypothetical protein
VYGRSDDEWDVLIDNTIPVLERVAVNRKLTNYTELNRELADATGRAPFDFSLERDRVAVGACSPLSSTGRTGRSGRCCQHWSST